MSWTVNINSVDRTSLVEHDSLDIQNILTKRVDSASFLVITDSPSNKPSLAQEVEIKDGTTTIFGGVISKIQNVTEIPGLYKYQIQCKDYTDSLDSKLVAETYENKTVNEIIDDINTKYLTGFTINNVDCSETVKRIQFNWQTVSSCLEDLAKYTGYDWYVDYAKDIHFFNYSGNPAPFDFDDDNGSYIKGTVSVIENLDQIRNAIYVRGGKYSAEDTSVAFVADGEAVAYDTKYQWSSGFTVYVDSTEQTVGIDALHDPDDYDCLYNDAEKVLKWRSDNKPAADSVITISGRPRYRLLAATEDPTSISTYGRREVLIVDSSIDEMQSARQRAEAEQDAYGDPQIEMRFQTLKPGLEAGQIITCNSSLYGFSGETYKVYAVTSEPFSHDKFKYTVELVSTKTLEYVDLMIALLRERAKATDIDVDQIIGKIKLYLETITLSDSETSTLNGTAWTYGLAHFYPTGTKKNFILNGSTMI